MLEHDCDTDEDCEVYFLKPVNEYNIVDKIKAANKELFYEEESTDTPIEQTRKVKFRANLADYAPNPEEDAHKDKNSAKDEGCYEVLTFDEDVEESVLPSDRTISTIEECAEMLALEVQKKIEAIEIKMPESDEEVEEICEEIVVMDMDTGRRLNEDTDESNATQEEVDKTPTDLQSKQEKTSDDEVNSNDDHTEEDEDDQLSIIVASYVPPYPLPSENGSSGTKSHSFSRHFSFRRKNTGKRLNCHSPEITNLKLNYKTCCEYRNSEGCKLPKYTGYMSEYGLSRDQLDKREQTLQKKNKIEVEKNLKSTESEVRKMQDNERAFTTWLKNKMRFPINRTKNMFDVRKANNNGASGGRNGIVRQKFAGNNKSGII